MPRLVKGPLDQWLQRILGDQRDLYDRSAHCARYSVSRKTE